MEASMSSIRFDKLKFVKILEKEGNQSPEMAEAFAKAVEEALTESQGPLATKADFQQGLTELRAEMKQEMSQLEVRLTSAMYKMAGFILAGVGVLMGLMKFIH
ncbi:hypothetical protein [Gallibacterium sp. AGMB14963]|uniref:hypothetical protein n=1 Tax=Gallibacterium faecale TaxID=3019086 RepID=UPI0022F1B63B|nr:hypothetical protein [Gallibacterium sp. AGMB14963]MDA3978065.1 hypothetical protein [Gallibacterium sp. AGMB14963]